MRKAYDFVGLPVVECGTGKALGTVKDFLLDRSWCVQGIIVQTKQWVASPRMISWQHVLSFGEDAVIIPDIEVFEKKCELPGTIALYDGERRIKGLPVYTEGGRQMGMVEDVYFSDKMERQIIGCELTEGFLNDLLEGRKLLPLPASTAIGEDAVIVPVGSLPAGIDTFIQE